MGVKESTHLDNYSPEVRDAIVCDFLEHAGQIAAVAMANNVAEAGVHRALNQAVLEGRLPSELRKPAEIKRRKISRCFEIHPQATNEQVARLAGVSEATVYRAKKQLEQLEDKPIEVFDWPIAVGLLVDKVSDF